MVQARALTARGSHDGGGDVGFGIGGSVGSDLIKQGTIIVANLGGLRRQNVGHLVAIMNRMEFQIRKKRKCLLERRFIVRASRPLANDAPGVDHPPRNRQVGPLVLSGERGEELAPLRRRAAVGDLRGEHARRVGRGGRAR